MVCSMQEKMKSPSETVLGSSIFTSFDGKMDAFENIPILVRDYTVIKSLIEEAKSSDKKEWYMEPQQSAWSGPYRHHLQKRQTYVEGILEAYSTKAKISSLLDLGCGDGGNFPWLKNFTDNLYASDYNLTRLMRAKNRALAKEIVLADVTDYAARDDSFDVVFCNHVLEHIPQDERALKEMKRIVKPGGIIILGIPNEGAFWWQLAYKLQPHTLKITDHVHFYTVKSLSEKILNAGLNIREVKRLGWGLPHWDMDARVRGYKLVDDFFEFFGSIIIPSQASSLYFILEK